jgi:hypothetical protein
MMIMVVGDSRIGLEVGPGRSLGSGARGMERRRPRATYPYVYAAGSSGLRFGCDPTLEVQ